MRNDIWIVLKGFNGGDGSLRIVNHNKGSLLVDRRWLWKVAFESNPFGWCGTFLLMPSEGIFNIFETPLCMQNRLFRRDQTKQKGSLIPFRPLRKPLVRLIFAEASFRLFRKVLLSISFFKKPSLVSFYASLRFKWFLMITFTPSREGMILIFQVKSFDTHHYCNTKFSYLLIFLNESWLFI